VVSSFSPFSSRNNEFLSNGWRNVKSEKVQSIGFSSDRCEKKVRQTTDQAGQVVIDVVWAGGDEMICEAGPVISPDKTTRADPGSIATDAVTDCRTDRLWIIFIIKNITMSTGSAGGQR
jgi:hypothetical protein